MTRKLIIWIILLLILAAASGWSWDAFASLPVDNREYFQSTGHWLEGEFFIAYYRAIEPKRVYGAPITEMYSPNPASKFMMQFFEKALFILLLDKPPGQRIEIVPLGEYLHIRRNPQASLASFAGCRIYSTGGFPVCYAFLEFFEAFGGVAQFGHPKSNIELERGYFVQYFERARLEWHPELPRGEKVVVADLGYEYFYLLKENPKRLNPVPGDVLIGILELHVRAFPKHSITGRSGKQNVYVIVQDQKTDGVDGARIEISVLLPDGTKTPYAVTVVTDENGLAQFEFDFNSYTIGMAIIEVRVRYGGFEEETVTSFRIWQ